NIERGQIDFSITVRFWPIADARKTASIQARQAHQTPSPASNVNTQHNSTTAIAPNKRGCPTQN
ncbi:hypothetical protein, partial [Pseudomonas sp. CFBP 13710]|uniref:hypothetical protein n=1 Tax=Pseudomonas sp. CFBP 13710 TaxID=2775311 RepID=UPI001A91E0FE